jgi:S1-C subfamily serine protease
MTIYAKHRFQSTVTSLGRVALFAALATTLLLASPDTNAQSGVSPGPQEVLEAVVGIDTRIPGTARTARTLGTQREGSGVVISDDGLVLTIGYLILEAIEIDIALADGKLIGIGSLFVGNAAFFQRPVAGNMFVPIDELKPILDEMVDQGRRAAAPRPWLGIRTSEHRDRLFVDGVSDDSPAARAGVRAGDLIVAVDTAAVGSMAGYFRAVWRDRAAGDAVTVRVLTPEGTLRDIEIESMDRKDWLRLDSSL